MDVGRTLSEVPTESQLLQLDAEGWQTSTYHEIDFLSPFVQFAGIRIRYYSL